MKSNLAKCDTLFISDNFFGYAEEIRKALVRDGRTVAWYPDRPSTDAFSKAVLRVFPALLKTRARDYVERIIADLKGSEIKSVLIIKGESLSPRLLKRLRDSFINAEFTLYFWDSYRNMPRDSTRKVDHVHRAFTFDPIDAIHDARLEYRPLFFIEAYGGPTETNPDIDVLFVGTVHTDRFSIISKIKANLPPGTRFHTVLFLQSKWIFWLRKIFDSSFRSAKLSDFVFAPLPASEVSRLVARSKIVLDIERPIQTGLTMRTIEMLGASKKLITTNSRVVEADFYDAANVLAIDRHNPVVDHGFLVGEYRPPSSNIVRRYSLRNWVQSVLPLREAKS